MRDAECFRVRIPEHSHLQGRTLTGQWAPVPPGEHVVHRMKLKVPLPGVAETLRFVGADQRGSDLHLHVPEGTDVEGLLFDCETDR